MKLTLRYLGRFSEDMSDVELPSEFADQLSVGQLRILVAQAAPKIKDRLMSCMIAVNTEYVENDQILQDGDEIAFLPPVSGG